MATAAATCSSRLAAEAMRVQLWQRPQKPARDWPLDQRSRGWRSHSTAMASMRARVYLPAPAGPERMSEWGRRPAAMAVRSDSTAGLLPWKSLKSAGRVGAVVVAVSMVGASFLRVARRGKTPYKNFIKSGRGEGWRARIWASAVSDWRSAGEPGYAPVRMDILWMERLPQLMEVFMIVGRLPGGAGLHLWNHPLYSVAFPFGY